MAHFAHVRDGIVQAIHVVNNDALTVGDEEASGQQLLASLYPDTAPAEWVQTSYNGNPVNGVDRGPYAGIGYTWDGVMFAPPPVPPAE